MCEATAFLFVEGQEKKIMENVVAVRRDEGERVLLAGLLGEQRLVQARVREIDFLRQRILLEATAIEG